MGKIVILDEVTANQIAAGEVIERPASIVKEMVENALDANATAITVDIVNGGVKSIRITDNGDGMEADDVELAFERHATSKIRKIDDLNRLSTMGFRGEALASIVSVSKMEMVTKTEEAANGIRVKAEAGNILSVEPAGAPKGTTFTVRELFWNTPARYKFLKKDTTEAGYVQDVLTRIALARPDVSIKFINQGKTLLHTPGNHDLLSVIYSIYGKEIARAVVPVNFHADGISVEGFVGEPQIARGNRSYQSILVNGRFIYNRIITAALEEAYKTRLMQKRFPFAVLKLSMSAQFVDVNVHPSKLEVRFSDEQKVFRAVYHAVSTALSQNASIPEFEALAGKTSGNGPDDFSRVPKTDLHSAGFPNNTPSSSQTSGYSDGKGVNQAKPIQGQIILSSEPHPKTADTGDSGSAFRISDSRYKKSDVGDSGSFFTKVSEAHEEAEDTGERSGVSQTNRVSSPKPFSRPELSGEQLQISKTAGNTLVSVPEGIKSGESSDAAGNGSAAPVTDIESSLNQDAAAKHIEQQSTAPHWPEAQGDTGKDTETGVDAETRKDAEILLQARVIGQAFESYILLEFGDEMLMIDQHAAHERIRYEKIKKQYLHKESFSQGLLSPLAVNLSELDMEKFRDYAQTLQKLGFEAEEFGNRTILIRAIPYILDSSFSSQDFLEILEKVSREIPSESEIIPEETLYMMACKSAIKANRQMTPMEIKGLVEELAGAENPYTCVHGRPVIIRMSKRELEKRFKRIV